MLVVEPDVERVFIDSSIVKSHQRQPLPNSANVYQTVGFGAKKYYRRLLRRHPVDPNVERKTWVGNLGGDSGFTTTYV